MRLQYHQAVRIGDLAHTSRTWHAKQFCDQPSAPAQTHRSRRQPKFVQSMGMRHPESCNFGSAPKARKLSPRSSKVFKLKRYGCGGNATLATQSTGALQSLFKAFDLLHMLRRTKSDKLDPSMLQMGSRHKAPRKQYLPPRDNVCSCAIQLSAFH